MSLNPATGSNVLIALGREQEPGIPGGGLIGYRSVLPIKADLKSEESESGAVNQSGYIEPAVPGKRSGKAEWTIPLKVGMLLEFLENILRGCTKAAPETGVKKYTFVPSITGVDTSFFGLFSKRPVEAMYLYLIKWGSIAFDIGDNEEIQSKFSGEIGHGTRVGAAIPDDDNTGTYAMGPYVRGPLKDRTKSVYVKVTRVTGGLQFKVEQTAGTPTFPGAAVDVALDPLSGRAIWQNLQGHTGLDLGWWDENKDPFEIVFPGEAADHADLAIGDIFEFPVEWADPAVTFLTGHSSFTSAHWRVRMRAAGSADPWVEKPVNSGSVSIAWPVTPDRGASSRYPFGITRDGYCTPEIELSRRLVDSAFIDAVESRGRLELQLLFEGRQIGTTGTYREGMTITLASARIDSNERDPASEKVITEKVKLTGERNDDGDPPVKVEIYTARDWTPST